MPAVAQTPAADPPASPAIDHTLSSLVINAVGVRVALGFRLSYVAASRDYDCRSFGARGVCVTFYGRYTNFAALNEGAGVLNVGYRLTETLRAGVIIDHRVGATEPDGISVNQETPVFGAFLAYSQHASGAGLQVKAMASAQSGRASITRIVENERLAEPGSGTARMTTQTAAGELGWGFVVSSLVATPYINVSDTTAARAAYTEAASAGVAYPISYDRFYVGRTTATAGLRLSGALTQSLGYQIGLGLEHDLLQTGRRYAVRSDIADLERFSAEIGRVSHRNRTFGWGGLLYQIDKGQRLFAGVSLRQTPLTPATSVVVGYQGSF